MTTRDPQPVVQPDDIPPADLTTRSGLRLHVRAAGPDDETALAAFFAQVTPEDLWFRFLSGVQAVGHERLAAMIQPDHRQMVTFLALPLDEARVVATATLAIDPDGARAEVALATCSDMKGHGVSWTLLEHVMSYAKSRGVAVVEAIENAYHDDAIRMEREMGFTVKQDPDDPTLRIARRVLG